MYLLIAVVCLLGVTLLYTLFIRPKDIPQPEPVSPTQHLDERKAAIYENLRDLQFEYRVGKLSDADYQHTKLSLQKELAVVIGEIAKMNGSPGVAMGTSGLAPTMAGQVAPQVAEQLAPAAALSQPAVAMAAVSAPTASVRPPDSNAGFVCPHCGQEFPVALKFCGECGKEMA